MSILRMQAVKTVTGHRSHASIYGAIRDGLFTKPVSIGKRSVGWPDDEIQKICDARIAGYSDNQMKQLVEQLHAERLSRVLKLIRSEVCHHG
jgi:prophage regulatory protein